jgi:hypothetical protein
LKGRRKTEPGAAIPLPQQQQPGPEKNTTPLLKRPHGQTQESVQAASPKDAALTWRVRRVRLPARADRSASSSASESSASSSVISRLGAPPEDAYPDDSPSDPATASPPSAPEVPTASRRRALIMSTVVVTRRRGDGFFALTAAAAWRRARRDAFFPGGGCPSFERGAWTARVDCAAPSCADRNRDWETSSAKNTRVRQTKKGA